MSFLYSKYIDLIDSGKIQEAITYRANFTPDYLYKFFWLSSEIDNPESNKRLNSLRNKQLWFATPILQNDPYEFKGIYFNKRRLQEIGIPLQSITDTETLFFKKTALTSFTANMSDNLPMWAHYANNHYGFCVKYKVGKKHAIRNIIYEKQRIPIANTFYSFIMNSINGIKNSDCFLEAEIISTILQDIFFTKHISWDYEQEYRALYPLDEEIRGCNVSIEEIGLSIVEIYSGIKCIDENKKILQEIASELQVPFKECKTSEFSFAVFE